MAVGCGGGNERSAEEIAGQVNHLLEERNVEREAIDLNGQTFTVSEQASDDAAEHTTCDALHTYSSEPAKQLSELLDQYSQQQSVTSTATPSAPYLNQGTTGTANPYLNQANPQVVDQLGGIASEIQDTQKAAEVAHILGC
jgi:hypothetical protein